MPREKRHHPEKSISFHHTTSTGHKEIHKTGELHVGPGGLSHSNHVFITKHGREHEPHDQDMQGEFTQHSHYEDEHTGHGSSKPFIDLIGGYVEVSSFSKIYLISLFLTWPGGNYFFPQRLMCKELVFKSVRLDSCFQNQTRSIEHLRNS